MNKLYYSQTIKKAEQIPENRFEIVCIIQLGKIEPSEYFSLMNPIDQAIVPVSTITKIVLILPAKEINITP